MKKQKKGNKGITLIALVVTIVILIILALISINAIFGEDGIVKTTNNARLLSEQGTVLEDLRMEIYEKMSNPEFGELGGLQYLKEQTEGKLRENNTIDVTKVREGIKSGRGSLDTGDVYYIEGAELFYLDKEKKAKNLGQIFSDAESLNPNLEINKEVTSTPANGERYALGEVVRYKITVKNIGTKTINNIKIEDTLKAIDIVTKEETVRLTQTFETLYDAEGNEIGDSLGAGKTGYITYSYTVVREDLGKDLSNKATVKGKTAIPKGEKPIVTPVEPPEGSIILSKKVIKADDNYMTPPGYIDGNGRFSFTLKLFDNTYNFTKDWRLWEEGKDLSKLSLILPDGCEVERTNNSIKMKLKENDTMIIRGTRTTESG